VKTYLDCIPCFFRQALQAARIATGDERLIKQILDDVGTLVKDIPLHQTPPETATLIYDTIRRRTGVEDPYAAAKRQDTRRARELYPSARRFVEESDEPLLAAVKIATVANAIDLGALEQVDVDAVLQDARTAEFAVFDFGAFRTCLETADQVLYLGDNAGESVFDRLLIEQLGKPVTFVVRERAVINDVIFDDAVAAGLDRVAEIVSSGCGASGLVPAACTPAFRERLASARMIISKGQGNYETLSSEQLPIFFLLKAKCRVIADDLGVKQGDLILKGSVWNTRLP